MVCHLPLQSELGEARVHLELAEEFRRAGHAVQKFDALDAFGRWPPTLLDRFRRGRFAARARAFITANPDAFDVIDAHLGDVPFSREQLGFRGLLVARSVGLHGFHLPYLRAAARARTGKTARSLGSVSLAKWKRLNQLVRPYYGPSAADHQASFRVSDLIVVPNHDELGYVAQVVTAGKCVVLPFGLSRERQAALESSARGLASRQSSQQVVFIGSWEERKGCGDWPAIVARVKGRVPGARFLFLGAGQNPRTVLHDLGLPPVDWIRIVPHFRSPELPGLLADSAVGAFPSYAETFGFGVLEKLAAGIPTVAYDVPGPREMLHCFSQRLLVPAGDVQSLSAEIVRLLTLDPTIYAGLARESVMISHRFAWPEIARKTLEVYMQHMPMAADGNQQGAI